MNAFDEINFWTAEAFLSRVPLEFATDGKTRICPACGKGRHGDGIRPRTNSAGQVKWHCFGQCNADYSNFDLAAVYYELSKYDVKEQAKRLAEIFGLATDKTFSFSKGKSARQTMARSEVALKEKKSADEPKDYARFYEYCRQKYPLDKFLEKRGGKWRGLTLETLNRAGAMYHAEYMFGEGDKRAAIILPYDDKHYFVREVEGKGKMRSKGDWGGAGLYEPLPIADKYPAVNFIVEGEIDALSIAQLFSGKIDFIGCVATGSASNWRKVVPELEKKFGKPRFIVIFDNDNNGIKSSAELVKSLELAGYPAVSFFFQEGKAGEKRIVENSNGEILEEYEIPKVDANDLLQKGDLVLQNWLYDTISESKLSLQAGKIAEQRTRALELEARQAQAQEQIQRAQENRSGFSDFRGDEYFAKQFLLDVSLSAKYSSRCTGFANLDGTGDFEEEGQKQIFMPGLYLLGATPGAGKTTFAWQLLNQLADNGEQCIFCSYEMSRLELFTKSIARELYLRRRAGHPVMKLTAAEIRRGEVSEDVQQVVKDFSFSKAMANLRVRELSNVNVVKLIESLKPLCTDADKPPVIAIDYLQIIPPTSSKATSKEKIDEIMTRLKDFQRATNSTIILISALNRESTKTNESPGLQAFRESSAIEYSCDVAWTLYTKKGEDGMKKNPREVGLFCPKNRNGETGYRLYFNYHCRSDCFVPCIERDLGDADD